MQYTMPYSQKYTPPHCFFCNFAGWDPTLAVKGLHTKESLMYRMSENWKVIRTVKPERLSKAFYKKERVYRNTESIQYLLIFFGGRATVEQAIFGWCLRARAAARDKRTIFIYNNFKKTLLEKKFEKSPW